MELGEAPIAYLDVTPSAVQRADDGTDTFSALTKPNTQASQHLRSTQGGTVAENATSYCCSVVHGSDNRWGMNAILTQLEGLAIFL